MARKSARGPGSGGARYPIYWNGAESAFETVESQALRVGQPAPMLVFESASWGTRITLDDLLADGLLLLAGSAGEAWCGAARELAERHGIDLAAHVIGGDLLIAGEDASALHGIAPEGAVMLDSNGIVIWESRGGAVHHRELLERLLWRLIALGIPGAGRIMKR